MMRRLGFITTITLTLLSMPSFAQEEKEAPQEDKLSYYEKRAKEDAAYEQSLTMDNQEDEADFWEDQQSYEKELKKRDKKAYKAYMKGKRDAYAEHEKHCGHSCHHSDYYHHHATFYYSYHRYHYPRRSTINTGVRIGTPSVRVGIF